MGLYVHVPFCRRKCRYCDFYSRPPAPGELDRFVAAVLQEIKLRAKGVRLSGQADTSPRVGTVYFGGGTPSMLGADRLARILDGVRESWQVVTDPQSVRPDVQANTSPPSRRVEITVEANPLDVTPDWARGAARAGFNRVSIGVQSVDEDDLRFLGRLHHAEDGPRAVAAAREAGLDEIGIDLIYGLPGQTTELLRDRVVRAVERCRPQHVSCYQLTYARGTPLWQDLEAGRVERLSNDEEYELLISLHELMAELGYPAYEVSNFSLGDAHRSRHNSHYWRHVPYVGLGPSAHLFLPPVRSWNVRSVEDYIARIEAGELPLAGEETLTDEQLASETVMLALRTTDGLDLDLYRERFGVGLIETSRDAIQSAVARGLVTVSESRLRPTLEGLAVADRLAVELG